MSRFEHLSIIKAPRSSINHEHDPVDIMFLVNSAIASDCEGWLDIDEFDRIDDRKNAERMALIRRMLSTLFNNTH
ncbi:hypothetical protein Shal_2726 [Shewanella halifaxensis HAW-EB4]|uniref:Uncharacterized protein n=1 Tax=Shewanella halifaxensis (strain HAW-EB4) TaxID=458817 RepID=B0TLQ7_SHEHH|nr:hypothetical protein Shal_2726 [Shewanella halifaxensis HAW-EB4]